MTRKPPLKNVGASVRARLTRRASERKENVQLALTRFAIERLLYRLSLSPHRDQFVLKGAMLFSLWAPTPYRATGDLDLLGYGDAAPERIAAVFAQICRTDVEDDGVVFKPETLRAEPARAEDEYSGVRITMTAEIAGARLPIQIDIGFGDAVTPAFAEDAAKQAQWRGFLRRTAIAMAPGPFAELQATVAAFVLPPVHALVAGKAFDGTWNAGGPWR